jgi:hypothetical protein
MRAVIVLLVLAGAAGSARAERFGGLSADGLRYLEGKNRVCVPAAVDTDGQVVTPSVCEPETDKAALKEWKFVGPARLKLAKRDASGWISLSVVVDGPKVSVMGDAGGSPRALAWQVLEAPIVKVRGPWLAGDGLLVIEVDTKDGKTKVTTTLGFDVRAGLSALAPRQGGLVAKVLQLGTTWTQKMIPCEQAGVTLVLAKDRGFTITTDVKCESTRDHLRVGGEWRGEEPDKLVFLFSNDGGPDEQLACQLATCTGGNGEECLSCSLGDVGFELKPGAPAADKKKPGLQR